MPPSEYGTLPELGARSSARRCEIVPIAAVNGDNKRIRNEAFKLALKLEEKLPPDQVIDGVLAQVEVPR